MDRYDRLNYQATVSTIGSMPRRWKDALYVQPPKNIEDYFSVEGPEGTMAEHVGAAIAQIRVLRGAVRTTSYNVPDPLEPEVLVAVGDKGSGPWPKSANEGLTDLLAEYEALKAEFDNLKPSDWNKSADLKPQDGDKTAHGRSFTIVDLARAVSRVSAERLGKVERTVRKLVD